MYSVIMTTFKDRTVGDKIINALLEQNLAACIQESEIKSHYKWQGKIEHENETLLLIKTRAELFDDIKNLILELHDYETPEIIMMPITKGSKTYLEWIENIVRP